MSSALRRALVLAVAVGSLIAAAGANGVPYAPPPADEHPVWSPDSSVVVYHRALQGLHVIDADGTHDRLLAGLPSSDSFGFTPDWRWIAFGVYDGAPNASHVEVMRPDGTNRRVVATNGMTRTPALSPDGTRVAYATADGLWVVAVDGSGRSRISSAKSPHELAWSPDGTRVAFVMSVDLPDASVQQVAVADVTNGTTRLARYAYSSGPSWSPDGKLAYFTNVHGVGGSIYRIVVEGVGEYGIGGTGGNRVVWSSDGRAVYYAGQSSIERVDLGSGWWSVVAPFALDFDIAPNGRVAYAMGGECANRVGIYVDTRRISNDCHVYGTPGRDELTSSGSLYEIVEGLEGNDVLIAWGAPRVGDALDGGTGNDVLRGGFWPDKLDGGSGSDTIHGGPNYDTITGGPGPDRLFGDGGRDIIYARDGERDVVDCGTNTGKTNTTPESDVALVDRIDIFRHCERVYVYKRS